MKNNKILGVVVWALGLALSLFLLFLIPKNLTGSIYAVAFCTALVYLLHLALWLVLQKGKLDFNNMPSLTLSIFFLLLQTIWTINVAFVVTIATKTAILINVFLILSQAFVIVLALISKDHIESISNRQKNHHTKL